MKHLLRIFSVLLVLASIHAFANSVSYTNLNATFNISADVGAGSVATGVFFGPGINLYWDGGSPGWFVGTHPGYAPGSLGGGGTVMLFDDAYGTIGSHTYPCCNIEFNNVIFNAGTFTFPTNGQNFTVTVPASFEVITGANYSECFISPCQAITLATRPGELSLSFYYSSYWGVYFGDSGSFTTTPEPGTLGMVAIGLGGVAWRWGKQKWV